MACLLARDRVESETSECRDHEKPDPTLRHAFVPANNPAGPFNQPNSSPLPLTDSSHPRLMHGVPSSPCRISSSRLHFPLADFTSNLHSRTCLLWACGELWSPQSFSTSFLFVSIFLLPMMNSTAHPKLIRSPHHVLLHLLALDLPGHGELLHMISFLFLAHFFSKVASDGLVSCLSPSPAPLQVILLVFYQVYQLPDTRPQVPSRLPSQVHTMVSCLSPCTI